LLSFPLFEELFPDRPSQYRLADFSQNVRQLSVCVRNILQFSVLGTLIELCVFVAGHHCWEAIPTQSAASTNDHHPEVCASGTSW